jgi:hypothetical protein
MKVLVTVRVGLQRSVLVTVTAFGPAVMVTGCGETVVSQYATVSLPQAPSGIAGGAHVVHLCRTAQGSAIGES